jgi:hypothetical protein
VADAASKTYCNWRGPDRVANDLLVVTYGLPRDRLNDGDQVLGAMAQFISDDA